MSSTFLAVLPLALGAAVSPTLLTIEVLILSGLRDQRPRAWAFAAGCAVALIAYMVALATLARGLQLQSTDQSTTESAVKLVCALALVALGVRALRRGPSTEPSAVQRKLAEARPRLYFVAGLAGMATNASSLVLIVPAMHVTVDADITTGQRAAILAFLFVVVLIPVWLPVSLVTVLGHRGDVVIHHLNEFTTAHSRQINAGIAFFFAVWLTYSALR